jgi:hypothetical protein
VQLIPPTLRLALLLPLLLLLAPQAHAQDRAMISGHLYVDTMGVLVATPVGSVTKQVSEEVKLTGRFFVDGISSASRRVDGVSSASPEVSEEIRKAGSASVAWERGLQRAAALVERSVEDDYDSTTLALTTSRDFAGRCTTVELAYARTFDQIAPERIGLIDGEWPKSKDTDSWRVSVVQVLSRTQLLTLTYNAMWVRGYQRNGYYADIIAYYDDTTAMIADAMPDRRLRHVASARLDQWLPIRGALHPFVRVYQDSWGVRSLTGELAYAQHLGEQLMAGLRYRHYLQSQAEWYRDSYDLAYLQDNEFHSLDYKFDTQVSQLWGAQLVFDLEPMRQKLRLDGLETVSVHASYDYYRQYHDDWAFVAHVGRIGMTTEF